MFVTEGVNVELHATCHGRYSSSFLLPVSCVQYSVQGVVSPGWYAIVVHKSGVQCFVGNYCIFKASITEV